MPVCACVLPTSSSSPYIYIYRVFVSGQRGENVQIVVIYFNRFFLLTQRQVEFQLKLDEHCGICSIDEYAGSRLSHTPPLPLSLCVSVWQVGKARVTMRQCVVK